MQGKKDWNNINYLIKIITEDVLFSLYFFIFF